MQASSKLLGILRKREALRLKAYQCQAGKWTIGYGHTRNVKSGDTCTPEQAEAWLKSDTAKAETIVNDAAKVAMTQPQFDALVSFAYNAGSLGIKLKQCVNAGDWAAVPAALREWKYVTDPETKKKTVSNGLIARREEEIAILEDRI